VVCQRQVPTSQKADAVFEMELAGPLARLDATDTLYAVESSRDYDPSPGLEKIRAPLLAINFADDKEYQTGSNWGKPAETREIRLFSTLSRSSQIAGNCGELRGINYTLLHSSAFCLPVRCLNFLPLTRADRPHVDPAYAQ